jgi:hypothetical protein
VFALFFGSGFSRKKARLFVEVAAGLEPAKTGFADQRFGLFGIAILYQLVTIHPMGLDPYLHPTRRKGLKRTETQRTLSD